MTCQWPDGFLFRQLEKLHVVSAEEGTTDQTWVTQLPVVLQEFLRFPVSTLNVSNLHGSPLRRPAGLLVDSY